MARSSLKSVIKLIDDAKNGLPVEVKFLNDLERSMEITEEKKSGKPSQTYKPSSMNCIRNMYYQVVGADLDQGYASYMFIGICNAGTDIHARVQGYISDMQANGFDCEYVNVADYIKSRKLDYLEIRSQVGFETKLYHKTLNLSFMCDGIIKYDNHYYILEIKSETSNKWYRRTGVDPSHYNQGIAYATSLGIDDVVFVYVNRDVLDMSTYMFHVTDDMKQELVGRIEECDGYVKRMMAPPKPDDLAKKTCEYCGYKTICRKDA